MSLTYFNIIELIFIPTIILLGLLTSYQDWRLGKIKNKWVVFSLVYFLVVYVFFIFYYSIKSNVDYLFIIETLTNLSFSIFLGFSLWFLGVWSAGDGKLFIAYSSLVPISLYSYGYIRWFPSFTLLINIFLIGFIYIIILILLNSNKKDLIKTSIGFFWELINLKNIFGTLIYLFAIQWIIHIFVRYLNLENSLLFTLGLAILSIMIIQVIFKDKIFFFFLFIAVIRIFIDKSIYSIQFVRLFIPVIILIIIMKSFLRGEVNKLIKGIFSKEVQVGDLKPKMLTGEIIVKKEKINKIELERLDKQENIEVLKYKDSFYIKKPKSINLDKFIDEESEGLTYQQIEEIKKIGFKKIKISQTLPFAPLMFLGVLATIFLHGNILIVILKIIGQ